MKALHTTEQARPHRRFENNNWRAAAVFIAALVLARPTEAQIPTGAILGGVRDAQGVGVPGATVTATNVGALRQL